MLTQSSSDPIDLVLAESKTPKSCGILTRRVWLPKIIYDFLPYFYLTAGFAASFATLYISDWFWVLPHYLLFAAACLHLASAVHNRRKATDNPRSSQD